MKLKDKVIAIAATIAMFASPVFAETRYVSGVVIGSLDRGSYSYENVPVQRCYNVTENRPSNGGDVLTGMIIGAIIGKGVSGNDKGAAAGAIVGGVIAGDNNNRQTSRQVCETVWEQQPVYRGGRYETTVMLDNGQQVTIWTDRAFRFEERIVVPVEY